MTGSSHHKARSAGGNASWWSCGPCAKRAYPSRRLAVAAARTVHQGGARLHAYECPAGSGGWHIGHLPKAVARGEVSKPAYVASVEQRNHAS